jgi:hypothetical protein
MKFTNETIATTKNNPLRVILTNMKPQIAKGIEMVVAQEEAQSGAIVSEFAKECIELGLIFDLYKSVVSYTKDSDEVKNFESGVSIKGNYELSGTIVRDGEEYGFRCEAIIADGMVNRRHFRYITKTSLPKDNMEEVNKVKAIIKKNNKIKSIQSYIDTLIGYREDAQKKYDEGIVVTREEWKAIIIEDGKWLNNQWEDIVEEGLHITRGWANEEEYLTFLNEANEGSIDWKIDFVKSNLRRIAQFDKSIAKEMVKLEKAKQA